MLVKIPGILDCLLAIFNDLYFCRQHFLYLLSLRSRVDFVDVILMNDAGQNPISFYSSGASFSMLHTAH